MAKQPPHDDDQAKKRAPETPKHPIPNMSLDGPDEEPLEVEEVLEAEVAPVESLPASEEEPFLLTEADVIEDVVEVVPEPEEAPASDVFLSEEEAASEARPESEVFEAAEVV